MEWANRFLTSNRGVKQITFAVSSFGNDQLRSNSAYMHQHVDLATGSRQNDSVASTMSSSSSSAEHTEAHKLAVGNGNSRASATGHSSCAAEHRTSAPVRTVSISRSGRYKSKSKMRSRLLTADVIDQSSATAAAATAGTSSSGIHSERAALVTQPYHRESDRVWDYGRVAYSGAPGASASDAMSIGADGCLEPWAETTESRTKTTTMMVSTKSGVRSNPLSNDETVVEHFTVDDLSSLLAVAFESTDF